jgi:hypothetical protein
VTIAGPPEAQPADGLAIDFVVEADRTQLGEVVQRVRDGRLRTNIGTVAALDDAVAAFNPTERIKGGRRSSAFVHRDEEEVFNESDCGDGSGRGNGRDEARGATRSGCGEARQS